ncbi:MAG: MFS transporter, partial [Rhodospirillaceae bacterium]|nr:MFS transporter [Rhodospirillaceae bacterium]
MVERGNAEAIEAEPRKSWRNALALYADRRILVILFLGFSSGLPLLLTLSTLSYWLATIGVDKTTIGLFALVGLPYTLKFVWAPVIDRVPIPVLSNLLGRRRSWVVVTQALLMAAIVLLGLSDPAQDPGLTALCAFILAFCSASQDIVIDA